MYFPNRLQSGFIVKMEPSEIQTVQHLAIVHQLNSPEKFGQAGKTGHCLSICFNFIKRYFDLEQNFSGPITRHVIKDMGLENGANAACAKTSVIYDSLFNSNCYIGSKHLEILTSLRQTVANTLGLSVVGTLNIQGSIEEIQGYLINSLEEGKYVITLPSHVVTLIKSNNALYLINPGGNYIEINNGFECGESDLFKFLLKSNVAIKESLLLSKVERQKDAASTSSIFQDKVVLSDHTSMQGVLISIKGQKDWAKREITWRGNTYSFIQHLPSGEIYNGNPREVIRAKLIILAAGRTLLETAARIVYHAGLFVLRSGHLVFLKCFTRKNTWELKLRTTQSFIDIFRAAVYGIAMLRASFYGIYKPYDGRRMYAKLENALNRGQSVREKWYTAPCFISLAKNGDWQSARLIRHIRRLNHTHLVTKHSCNPFQS